MSTTTSENGITITHDGEHTWNVAQNENWSTAGFETESTLDKDANDANDDRVSFRKDIFHGHVEAVGSLDVNECDVTIDILIDGRKIGPFSGYLDKFKIWIDLPIASGDIVIEWQRLSVEMRSRLNTEKGNFEKKDILITVQET